MDQRRYITIVLVTMVFYIVWMQIAPKLFPDLFPKPQPKAPIVNKDDGQEPEAGENAEADPDVAANPGAVTDADPKELVEAEAKPEKLAKFPHHDVMIGKPGFEAGYLIQAECSTRGGAVNWVQLTDPRYTNLERTAPLKVVGNDIGLPPKETPKSFATLMPLLDKQLEKHDLSLADVEWEIVKQDAESITFHYPSPDGTLEAIKTYKVSKSDTKVRDEEHQGYLLDFEFSIRNLTEDTIETQYSMQGPVGVPLENIENTNIYREFKLGSIEEDDPEDVTAISLTATKFAGQLKKAQKKKQPVDSWRDPLHYVGVDCQFFAALILPQGDLLKDIDGDGIADPFIESARPEILNKHEDEEKSEISLVLESRKLSLKAGDSFTHEYQAYFGPKRSELLQPMQAGEVIQFGWFGIVAKLMLSVLGFFHSVIGLPYAYAIILLTVCVRGMMFPISKRQVVESEKMRVLAPKLKLIQEKHKDKPEEFAKAYREFQKKHNYHPMVGCLPALLQMPIFIGLYRSLFYAVDLRLSQFLWIDNLAAPDALCPFPFQIPFIGGMFNLLPVLTVILFVAQQKMFTPPPTDEQQEMTQKMMSYMMIFIGYLFYRSPAGLCLYFISSSLWGITERTILKKYATSPAAVPATANETTEKPTANETPKDDTPQEPGFLQRLINAADEARNTTANQSSPNKDKSRSKKKKNKKR